MIRWNNPDTIYFYIIEIVILLNLEYWFSGIISTLLVSLFLSKRIWNIGFPYFNHSLIRDNADLQNSFFILRKICARLKKFQNALLIRFTVEFWKSAENVAGNFARGGLIKAVNTLETRAPIKATFPPTFAKKNGGNPQKINVSIEFN